MPDDAAVLTIEFKVNLIAPARGPRFRFEGLVVKAGRTISVVDGRATQHDEDGSNEKLIATMTATVMTVHGREALKH
jgi:acyl-coenzyme A thioesterase PaaI-like protein